MWRARPLQVSSCDGFVSWRRQWEIVVGVTRDTRAGPEAPIYSYRDSRNRGLLSDSFMAA
jgi:hypothetical protein